MSANKKLASGLTPNLAAALSYVGVWITGIIFFLVEKDNFVRFHALQSALTFGILSGMMMIPFIGWMLSPVIWIIGFIIWLICIVKAYQGEEFFLPFIGNIAKKIIKQA